jgi:hypothetical protein
LAVGEQAQQIELAPGELDLNAADGDAVRYEIDREIAQTKHGTEAPLLQAMTQGSAHTREQLLHAERLHHVIVRPASSTGACIDKRTQKQGRAERHEDNIEHGFVPIDPIRMPNWDRSP